MVSNVASKCVTIVVGTLLVLWTTAQFGVAQAAEGQFSGTRNERSTPRESVLPASPAIATILGVDSSAEITLGKALLLRLGYDVGRFDGVVSAKLVAAIYHFQQDNGLKPTGQLDQSTFQILRAK